VAPPVTAAPPQQQPTERGDREVPKNSARMEQTAQPPGFGTGKGVLGVLPANQATSQAMAYADPTPRANVPPPVAATQPAANPVAAAPAPQAAKPQLRAGTWIVQVGALESEAEANKRLSDARASASAVLGKADQFTEVVDKGDKRLYRALRYFLHRNQKLTLSF
jgi:D-alanyl-D-alanine carboxypeptidase